MSRHPMCAVLLTTGVLASATASLRAQDPVEQLDRLLGIGPKSSAPTVAPGLGEGGPAKVVARIGVVDMALVFVFHPAMLDYVRIEKSFLRPAPEATDEVARQKLIRQRWERSRDLYTSKAMEERRTQFVLRQRQVSQRRIKAYESLRHDLDELIKASGAKEALEPARRDSIQADLAVRMKEREKAYWVEISRLEREERELVAEVERVNEQVRGQVLLTRREVPAQIRGIVRDIEQAVAALQAERGLTVVINEGLLEKKPVAAKENVNLEPYPMHLYAFVNTYREFLDSPAQFRKSDPDFGWHGPPRNRLQWLLSRYLQDQAELAQPFWSSPSNRFILGGAQDITAPVLGRVLERFDMPREKKDEIVAFVAELRRRAAEGRP